MTAVPDSAFELMKPAHATREQEVEARLQHAQRDVARLIAEARELRAAIRAELRLIRSPNK